MVLWKLENGPCGVCLYSPWNNIYGEVDKRLNTNGSYRTTRLLIYMPVFLFVRTVPETTEGEADETDEGGERPLAQVEATKRQRGHAADAKGLYRSWQNDSRQTK